NAWIADGPPPSHRAPSRRQGSSRSTSVTRMLLPIRDKQGELVARPFGDPEGGRDRVFDGTEGEQEIEGDFVILFDWLKGRALRSLEEESRIIIGRKGAGKSRLLHEIHKDLSDTKVLSLGIEQYPPNTANILKVARWFEPS